MVQEKIVSLETNVNLANQKHNLYTIQYALCIIHIQCLIKQTMHFKKC